MKWPLVPVDGAGDWKRKIAQALNFLLSKYSNPQVDYIDFEQGVTVADAPARMWWHDVDATMNIGMEYGVVQQVGLEAFTRVRNNTGVTIPNGAVVGYTGVDSEEVAVAPYLADGSVPVEAIIGVMTHDLPDMGTIGYATTTGKVRGLDTSAWPAGTPLYASPTVAGELTDVKPTAPDNVISLAVVIKQDATEGIINVRVQPETRKLYGFFTRTSTATAGAINTAQTITWENDIISDGIAYTTTQVEVDQSGLYRVEARLQLQSGSSSDKQAYLWFSHNGSDVSSSATVGTSTSNSTYLTLRNSMFISLDAGDYVEVKWATDNTGLTVSNVAASAFAPASPAATLQITQVQQ